MKPIEIFSLHTVSNNFFSFDLHKKDSNVILRFIDFDITFLDCILIKCGYPNEEVYIHYEYYTQESMVKYCLYELLESVWIMELKEMNSAHPRHSDQLFKHEKHFIILFEDEVFECICGSYVIN